MRVLLQAASPSLTDWHDYITPDNLMTLVAAGLAALIAAGVAVYGYSRAQREARRQERARLYAEALRAVEDYLEAPYRVKRRDGSAAARRELTEAISEIKSRINFYTGWLSISAPQEVNATYGAFAKAAFGEAGAQMTTAWKGRPTKRDRDVPIGQPLPRVQADKARDLALATMKNDLTR